MAEISLKKFLSKKENLLIIKGLMDVASASMSIKDTGGNELVSNKAIAGDHESLQNSADEVYQHEIGSATEILGWVIGSQKDAFVATTIAYLLNKEIERKNLASEVIDKYREINFLYNISGKMATCLSIREIAALVIDEAWKLIKATSGSVMLLNEKTGNLEIIYKYTAITGREYHPKSFLRIGVGIAGYVVQTGKAEIVNDVSQDPRYLQGENSAYALICAPLTTKDKTIGVINISNEAPISYTSQDLKLFSALTAQAAPAIENAMLHANKLQEERIKNNLERYLSPQVVAAVIEAKGKVSLDTRKRHITMLFSDIRNFTTKCEELPAERIVTYLNEYFTHMVEEIFGHKGTVNKFVGDMIVAMFGAPEALVDQERWAIEAAIAMQKRIQTIPVEWIRENFITGIGISSGDVVVGNIGSPQHMDYTVIGDEVNVAARLQGIAKGGQILVSRSVYDVTKHLFKFQEFGNVTVKGKKKTVEIFEVLH